MKRNTIVISQDISYTQPLIWHRYSLIRISHVDRLSSYWHERNKLGRIGENIQKMISLRAGKPNKDDKNDNMAKYTPFYEFHMAISCHLTQIFNFVAFQTEFKRFCRRSYAGWRPYQKICNQSNCARVIERYNWIGNVRSDLGDSRRLLIDISKFAKRLFFRNHLRVEYNFIKLKLRIIYTCVMNDHECFRQYFMKVWNMYLRYYFL